MSSTSTYTLFPQSTLFRSYMTAAFPVADLSGSGRCQQACYHESRQPARKGRSVGLRLALDDARLIQQQPGGVLHHGAGAILAQLRGQRMHEGMARIDLQDALRAAVELALLP